MGNHEDKIMETRRDLDKVKRTEDIFLWHLQTISTRLEKVEADKEALRDEIRELLKEYTEGIDKKFGVICENQRIQNRRFFAGRIVVATLTATAVTFWWLVENAQGLGHVFSNFIEGSKK